MKFCYKECIHVLGEGRLVILCDRPFREPQVVYKELSCHLGVIGMWKGNGTKYTKEEIEDELARSNHANSGSIELLRNDEPITVPGI